MDSEKIDWEARLRQEGLSMSKGSASWLAYVEDTDIHQRERPRPVPPGGGLLAREYHIGEAQEIRHSCVECGKSFSSNHADRKLCGEACKKRAQRKSRKVSEASHAIVG